VQPRTRMSTWSIFSLTHELSFFFISPPCSAPTQWMAIKCLFGGSVVGKASTIGREISPTPPLIFTGGQKVWNLVSFKTSLKSEPPMFESAARYPNSETNVQCCNDRPMSWPSLVKLGPCTPKKSVNCDPPPRKLHTKTCWNVSNSAVDHLIYLTFCMELTSKVL